VVQSRLYVCIFRINSIRFIPKASQDSQPVSGLQVLSEGGNWLNIKHYPEHIIANIGDTLEFVSGGILRAVPHRVVEPPIDQCQLKRLGVFYFVHLLPDIALCPLDQLVDTFIDTVPPSKATDSFKEYYACGGQPLSASDWVTFRSSLIGRLGSGERSISDDYLIFMIIKRGLSRERDP